MATQVNKIIFKVEGDTTGITKALDKVDGKLEDVADGTKDVTKGTEGMGSAFGSAESSIDRMTGGAVSGFKGMVGGIKKGVLGMKSFKIALASTGIGLIVIAIGSLVAFFTKSKRGAEMLEVATAVLGAVFDKVTDGAVWLGEKLMGVFTSPKEAVLGLWDTIKTYFIDKFNAVIESVGLLGSAFTKLFSGDFSGALTDATKGATGLFMELTPMGVAIETAMYVVEKAGPVIKQMAKELSDSAKQAQNLARRSIALRQSQRDLNLEFAEGRAQIKELNLIAEDLSKPLEDRIKASEEAIAIEKSLMSERQRIAQEELDIHVAKMSMSENVEEDLEKQNELEVALINIRTESAEMQTTLNNKLQTMRNADFLERKRISDEIKALEEETQLELARKQLEAEELLKGLEQRELDALTQKFIDLAQVFEVGSQELIDLQNKYTADSKAITDKFDKIELDAERQVQRSKLDMAKQGLGALIALNNAFAKDDEKSQKKAFQRNKALSMSTAVVNTYLAISDALAKDSVTPFSRYVSSAIAGAMGLAQVVAISKTRYKSAETPSVPSSSMGSMGGGIGGGGGTTQAPPSIDFGFLGEGAGQGGIQAYVISQNVTTSQQSNQLIQDQVTL